MGQKILVVEDNELNLKLFCDLLRAHGYEAEPVRDGREAVERARAFAARPDRHGHPDAAHFRPRADRADEGRRRACSAIPIMAVTAYAAKGDEERIRDAGAEGYVSKPISVLRFVEAVRALLALAGTRAAEAPETEAAAAPEGEAAPDEPSTPEGESDPAIPRHG